MDEEMTPIETYNGVYVKRDDKYLRGNVCGGKARAVWHLVETALKDGPVKGLTTATARESPQMQIVARVANLFKLPCTVHCPAGVPSYTMMELQRYGAMYHQHKAGYNTVLVSRARDYAIKTGFYYIPFGLECREAMLCTSRQVESICFAMAFGQIKKPKRIVVPIGGGMSACGILWGLSKLALSIPVLGVQVGASPLKRMDTYAPPGWQMMIKFVQALVPYKKEINASIGGIHLDPGYEAKCVSFLEPGDLFWIVGMRDMGARAE